MDALLVEKAATWAKTNIEMVTLLKELNSIQDTIIRFKTKFLKQFSESLIKIESVSFNIKILELRQSKDEFLLAYYKRVMTIMKKINTRDQERSVLLS